MEIYTDRLKITEITKKDIKNIHAMNSIPAVARYNTIGIPENLRATESMLLSVFRDQEKRKRTSFDWTIKDRKSGEFLGEIGMSLGPSNFKMGEIHYSLLPLYWGNGYATEAVCGLIDYAFGTMGLHRIEAGVASENVKSIALLERIGMRREGVKRKILPIRGEWKDSVLYAVLDDEWG